MMMIVPLLLVLAQEAVDPEKVVATVLDRKITAQEIGWKTAADLATPPPGTCGPNHPVSKLQSLVWKDVAQQYIEAKGLKATPEEVREVVDWSKEFEGKERKRRAKDLAETEEKLKTPGIPEGERRQLESRRETLRSLAATDKLRDDLEREQPEVAAKSRADIHGIWIEASKLDIALHKEFGGTVAITKFGQVPVGARTALLRRTAKEGKLTFADAGLERLFWAEAEAPPRWVAAPDKVDLRPYWKLDR